MSLRDLPEVDALALLEVPIDIVENSARDFFDIVLVCEFTERRYDLVVDDVLYARILHGVSFLFLVDKIIIQQDDACVYINFQII